MLVTTGLDKAKMHTITQYDAIHVKFYSRFLVMKIKPMYVSILDQAKIHKTTHLVATQEKKFTLHIRFWQFTDINSIMFIHQFRQ